MTQFHDLSKTEARYLPKLRDLPARKIAWSLACLLGACSLLAIFFYVEHALPQGPGELRMWPGDWVFLGAAALFVASWVIVVQIKDAWMHRRIGLALLRYLDHQLNIHYPFYSTGSEDPPYSDLGYHGWIERAKLLTELGRFKEALDSRVAAKQVDLRDMKAKRPTGSYLPHASNFQDESIAGYKVDLRLHEEGRCVSDVSSEEYVTLCREELRLWRRQRL